MPQCVGALIVVPVEAIVVKMVAFRREIDLVLSRTMKIETRDARTVIRICGFGSVAMLDYLERSEVFRPQKKRTKNRGKKREYNFRDVLVLKTISTLLQNGATVSNLKNALSSLQTLPWKAEPAVLEDSQGALRHLVVSGGKIYFSRNNEELVDLTSGGQLSFFFILDIDKIHSDVAKEWNQTSLSFVA